MADQPRFTVLGKLLSILLIGGLIALGGYMVVNRGVSTPGGSTADSPESSDSPEVAAVQVEVPKLAPPAAFQLKDNTVPVEQNQRLTKAVKEAGGDAEIYLAEGAGHGFTATTWPGVEHEVFDVWLPAHHIIAAPQK